VLLLPGFLESPKRPYEIDEEDHLDYEGEDSETVRDLEGPVAD